MIGELGLVPQGNDKPPHVVAGDRIDILLVGIEEFREIADAGDDPVDRLRALAFGPGISFLGYQCVLKCHDLFFLTLIA